MVGSVPSSVYLIQAPGVAQLKVMETGFVKAPPAGEILGAAAGVVTTIKFAVATGLGVYPVANPTALTVAELLSQNEPE